MKPCLEEGEVMISKYDGPLPLTNVKVTYERLPVALSIKAELSSIRGKLEESLIVLGLTENGYQYVDSKKGQTVQIKELTDEVVDDIVFILTEDLQEKLLNMEVGIYIGEFESKNIGFIKEFQRSGEKVELVLVSSLSPNRKIIFYMEDGDIMYDYEDVNLPEPDERILSLDLESEEFAQWLRGN